MVSIGPYSQSMNFTSMFDPSDLRGHLPKETVCPNSIADIVNTHSDFSKFRYLLKLSKLEGLYGAAQANCTLFVPSDDALKHIDNNAFLNMDDATARHIVRTSTLDRRITSDILADSPAAWFHTRDKPNRLWVTNISGRTYINNCVNVIHKDMAAVNGIIHVVDNLIWPDII